MVKKGNKEIVFEHVDSLYDCNSFNELEKEYDGDIFYADGDEHSVLNAIRNEEIDFTNVIDFYYFDNWAIAMHKY